MQSIVRYKNELLQCWKNVKQRGKHYGENVIVDYVGKLKIELNKKIMKELSNSF